MGRTPVMENSRKGGGVVVLVAEYPDQYGTGEKYAGCL
jgi:hypothetical protein